MYGEWATDSRIVVGKAGGGTLESAKTKPGTHKNYLISSLNTKQDLTNPYYVLLMEYNAGKILTLGTPGRFRWSEVIDELLLLKSASATANYSENEDEEYTGSTYKVRIISDLALYFRENSHDKVRQHKTGLKDGKNIQIQNMIMYAVLVGQSVILFIAYIKRLFYVIMLAMLAPVVVVVDFFQKFGK